MKLKSFSPLGVTIQQSIFMKRLTYIRLFFPAVSNTIGFAKKQIRPLHHDHMIHILKILNPETD